MSEIVPKNRIQSIDLLRGLVMVVMALDHCRDFFHLGNFNGEDPLDFKTTWPALFVTRWITHFCAPVFVFLAGTSIAFMSRRKSKAELSAFLLTRGFWLIFMELTIINWGWAGNLSYDFVGLQVIWALGISMVFISGLIYLPHRLFLGLGLLIVFGHNFLDPIDNLLNKGLPGGLWALVHTPHFYKNLHGFDLGVFYPFLPWLGLMILGYGLGDLFKPAVAAETRQKSLLLLGLGCIVLFGALRSVNIYGDSFHWETQANPLFSAFSFVNTTKYPPSLLYMLMTIGPALLFLAFIERAQNLFSRTIIVFGRVPLFYYVMHLYLFHFMAVVFFLFQGHTLADLDSDHSLGGFPDGFGIPLRGVYGFWLLGIFLLYFPCRWYDAYKTRHPEKWWLSYL